MFATKKIRKERVLLENPGIDPGTSRMLSGTAVTVFLEAFAAKERSGQTSNLKCF